MFEAVADFLKGKPAVSRSAQWPATRKAHLAKHPTCEVCGTKKNLEVHHIFPFHICPEGELTPENLITLCEGGGQNHHLLFGHVLSWFSYNEHVRQDAAIWKNKITTRP